MVLDEPEMLQKILEIREEVNKSNLVNERNNKYIKMMSITFRRRFDIGAMRFSVVEKIKRLSDERDLELATKSGGDFCALEDNDWIVITLNPVIPPREEWFDKIIARDYESESKVSTYFIAPLLERLGYNYEDICMEHPVIMDRGHTRDRSKHADFAVFNGPGRDAKDVLLVIEAKVKDITEKDIGEARSYARELLPAYYLVTNGKYLNVFGFNGMKILDSKVMELDISMLKEKWKDLYRCISKEATISRKLEVQNKFSS
jgi:hypothetical protein